MNKLAKNYLVTAILSILTFTSTSGHASSYAPVLADKPSAPPADPTKYSIAIAENFKKSKNHFSKLKGKTSSNIKTISFNAEVGDQWEWGVDYLYYKTKTQYFNDNRADYATKHELLPNAYYFFTPDTYIMVVGGARYSRVKMIQDPAGNISRAKTSQITPIIGAQVGTAKTYGIWTPSINGSVLYENERTNKYVLDNELTKKKWEHCVYGQITGQLDIALHEKVQPYAKIAYQNILRRSKSYTIQKWDGWFYTGGINFYPSSQWNPYIEFNHNRNPSGERDNVFQIGLSYNF